MEQASRQSIVSLKNVHLKHTNIPAVKKELKGQAYFCNVSMIAVYHV